MRNHGHGTGSSVDGKRPRTTRRFTGLAGGLAALALSGGALLGVVAAPAASAVTATPAPQLHVSGNMLVDQNGDRVVLHGVNRSGGEFACVQDKGIWDGPMDQASIDAIKAWGVTAVRVPLNEACWNGESYVDPAYAGANYTSAVKSYINLLNSNGLVAIIDLHWTDGAYTGPSSGCASAQAICQKPMPDAAQAVPFWTSVANSFRGNDAVIFDLFNEPYASRATGSETSGWQCWLNGGTCSGIPYQVAGMQSLVNAVRSTGADNVIMLGGEEYSNELTQWLQYEPADPDGNLVASWHDYNFNTCAPSSCWTSQIAPVIARVPVVAGEIGESDCGHSFVDGLMNWLDSEQTSYLAWTWNNWGCGSGPALITDYTGTPTAYGAGVKAHLQALANSGGGGSDTTPPSVPSGLRMSGTTASSVSLSWSPSTDNVGVVGYDVSRNGTQVGTATGTSFTDTGLTASTVYSYSVKAFDAAGNVSAASAAVSATTASGGGGGASAISVLYKNNDSAPGDAQIKPGLELVNNGSSALDLSTVTVRYYFTHDAGATSFAFGCDYAALGCGNVHGSFVSMASPTATADTYLQLSFTGSLPAGANSGDIQNRINKSDWSNFDETNDYSYRTNTSYAMNPAITVYVAGALVAGTEPGGTTGGDTTPPSAPSGVKVTGTTSSSVSLSWTASTDNVGVTGYQVLRGGTLVGSPTGTSFTDTGLSAGTAYSYTVKAVDAAGNVSAASAAVTATTSSGGDTTPPSAPTGVKVSGVTSSSVSLSWTAATDNVGVTGYQVLRGGTLVGSPTGTSFTDTGLSAGTAYSYTVKAVDAAGNVSAASAAVTATTAASTGGGGCAASFHNDSDWGSGFNATVTVTNTGTATTSGWKVTWTWGGNQAVTNYWNATLTSTGSSVTATNLGYNGAIAPGGNTTFGVQANYTGTNTAPTLTCTAS